LPKFKYFLPAQENIDEVTLKVEEPEAIRLKDLEELMQEECAQKMRFHARHFNLF